MLDVVTIDEVKQYMRVDYPDEDETINNLLQGAQVLCKDVARLSSDDWDNLANADTGELTELKNQLRVAVLYTVSYLSEHREEADHHDLNLTLRNLLFAIREGL